MSENICPSFYSKDNTCNNPYSKRRFLECEEFKQLKAEIDVKESELKSLRSDLMIEINGHNDTKAEFEQLQAENERLKNLLTKVINEYECGEVSKDLVEILIKEKVK